MSDAQLKKFAHRVGKRLLVDDGFLDDLADALDGIDLADELSESDSNIGDETIEATNTDDDEYSPPKKKSPKKAKRATKAESSDESSDDVSDDDPETVIKEKSEKRKSKRSVKF